MLIIKSLLTFALELNALEDMLLVALGLSWHWDTEGLNMSPYRYRKVIISMFTAHGFTEYATTEPDISMESANVMLVRVGNRVGARDVERFKRYIRRTPDIENFQGNAEDDPGSHSYTSAVWLSRMYKSIERLFRLWKEYGVIDE